ncbi:MAG: 50S ribosomal protein L18 [Actinobacteria bacterium ADurb.Bin346]|nr:MAG: 50S ribosomal protein L18 [Actinobacteria bacterium ADurb.Bin346]
MKTREQLKDRSYRRKSRVTIKVSANRNRHILYVYRSNKYIYAQIVDVSGRTIVGISSKNIETPADAKGKIDISFKTGKLLAEKAKARKISEIVFNRGCYRYHGRIKALAQGAREGGLKF